MEDDRLDSHSISDSDSFGMDKVFMFSCPYLGTIEDPDTSLAYPATANHCFRMKSTAAVDLIHQESYCLTDNHPGCHVFQKAVAATKEDEKSDQQVPVVAPSNRRRRVSFLALPIILILLVMAAIIWWPEPGVSLREASVFGAADQTEISSADSSDSVAVEGVVIEEFAAEADASSVVEASAEPAENAGPAANEVETADAGLVEDEAAVDVSAAVEENAAESAAAAGSGSPEEAAASDDEPLSASSAGDSEIAETVNEPESAAGADELEESNADQARAEQEELADNVEVSASEIAEANVNIADVEAVEAEAAATDVDQPRVVIGDLPMLSADSALIHPETSEPVTTQPTSVAAVSPAGEMFAHVGPETNALPALREGADDVEALFFRQGPSTESDLLALITRREQVNILGRDASGLWIKVRLDNGLEGWVDAVKSRAGITVSGLPMSDAAAAADAQASAPPPVTAAVVSSLPIIRSAVVTTGALNLRAGPGVGYEPITIVYDGEAVGLLGRLGGSIWVRVRTADGLEGWMNSALLGPIS